MSEAKKDEKAYCDWLEIEGVNYSGPHHLAWWAACTYKDKRITELKAENQKLWDIVGELQRGGLDLQSLSEGGADE